MKDIAPSSELRKWFAHDVAKWPEFQRRYQAELAKRSEDVRRLVDLACNEPVTLVFAARDCEHNSAVVLKQTIERKLQGRRKP